MGLTKGEVVGLPIIAMGSGLNADDVFLLCHLLQECRGGEQVCTLTEKEILEKTGLTRGRFRDARQRLIDSKFIQTKVRHEDGRPVTAIRINPSVWDRNLTGHVIPLSEEPKPHRKLNTKAPSSWDRIGTNGRLDEEASAFANKQTKILMQALVRHRIVPTQHNTSKWPDVIDRFLAKNALVVSEEEFADVMNFWKDHATDPYVPLVQSTKSFCEKFGQITAAQRRQQIDAADSDTDRLAGRFAQ